MTGLVVAITNIYGEPFDVPVLEATVEVEVRSDPIEDRWNYYDDGLKHYIPGQQQYIVNGQEVRGRDLDKVANVMLALQQPSTPFCIKIDDRGHEWHLGDSPFMAELRRYEYDHPLTILDGDTLEEDYDENGDIVKARVIRKDGEIEEVRVTRTA